MTKLLDLPRVCFGTSPLASVPELYGYEVQAERARETIRAALKSPFRFLDTSRNYGPGRSETLIGEVIREMGGPPDQFTIATKLDRDAATNRFDGEQARRSLEESLNTLGLSKVDILHIHDPEYAQDIQDVTKKGGALDTLFKMKEEGFTDAVGIAMGNITLLSQLLEGWPFDAMLTHNRFTLLNRQADQVITQAAALGIAVFNAAPYSSGVLAKGENEVRRYVYRDLNPTEQARIAALRRICDTHDIPVGAAALQFSMRDRRITSTICGISKPERVAQTVEWSTWPIPEAVWAELMELPFSIEDPQQGSHDRHR
ncbi:aldo/keto reductase [Aquamicrobium sp. LC103]|uniref:aldo/keto reductase n=1 Tax=Aquamicrobium sp. LC103 TaxID=1120658 RepID=UPI00063EBEC1|nr:aldo/keto reductase [Aquamicrobium sp. LC103]TKT69521.1 aldo/keto reductase [Aquamicrobium sp. LC103]